MEIDTEQMLVDCINEKNKRIKSLEKENKELKLKCEYIKQKAKLHKGHSPFAKMCLEELSKE